MIDLKRKYFVLSIIILIYSLTSCKSDKPAENFPNEIKKVQSEKITRIDEKEELALTDAEKLNLKNKKYLSEYKCNKPQEPQEDICVELVDFPNSPIEMHQEVIFSYRVTNFGIRDRNNIKSELSLYGNAHVMPSSECEKLSKAELSSKGVFDAYSCTIKTLKGGESKLFSFKLKPIAAGKISPIVSVNQLNNDSNAINNSPPMLKFLVNPSNKTDESLDSFLKIRQKCVEQHGEDKLKLRRCMIDARK